MTYLGMPIKRMSILEKRPQDDRAFFSKHWREIHGGMVSRLPFLASYIQNHIIEDFLHGQAGLPGDGFVEQLWRSTAEMQRGYNSPVVKDLISDEVNYLGHGSNYAILASEALRPAPDGSKLVIAIRHGGDVDVVDTVASGARTLAAHMVRDDVIATIAKPNMLPVQPHPVDAFLHVYFDSAQKAASAAQYAARNLPDLNAKAAIGIWRVRTETIV